jgi:hypothetical protein
VSDDGQLDLFVGAQRRGADPRAAGRTRPGGMVLRSSQKTMREFDDGVLT